MRKRSLLVIWYFGNTRIEPNHTNTCAKDGLHKAFPKVFLDGLVGWRHRLPTQNAEEQLGELQVPLLLHRRDDGICIVAGVEGQELCGHKTFGDLNRNVGRLFSN